PTVSARYPTAVPRTHGKPLPDPAVGRGWAWGCSVAPPGGDGVAHRSGCHRSGALPKTTNARGKAPGVVVIPRRLALARQHHPAPLYLLCGPAARRPRVGLREPGDSAMSLHAPAFSRPS